MARPHAGGNCVRCGVANAGAVDAEVDFWCDCHGNRIPLESNPKRRQPTRGRFPCWGHLRAARCGEREHACSRRPRGYVKDGEDAVKPHGKARAVAVAVTDAVGVAPMLRRCVATRARVRSDGRAFSHSCTGVLVLPDQAVRRLQREPPERARLQGAPRGRFPMLGALANAGSATARSSGITSNGTRPSPRERVPPC